MDVQATSGLHRARTGAPDQTGERDDGASQNRSRLVLIVDDEATIVELLALLFEDEGFDILRAYDGEQALRLALHHHPDLIISDISLPRLNGVEMLRRLRANGNGASATPVILMSAIVRDAPADNIVFVPKPFDLESMLTLAEAQLAVG